LHMRLRKIVKNRGHFPSDEAATKLLFLALRNIEKDLRVRFPTFISLTRLLSLLRPPMSSHSYSHPRASARSGCIFC
jgi:hypothetical protein